MTAPNPGLAEPPGHSEGLRVSVAGEEGVRVRTLLRRDLLAPNRNPSPSSGEGVQMPARCFPVLTPGPQATPQPPRPSLGSGRWCGLHRPRLFPWIPTAHLWPGELLRDTRCRKQQNEDAEVGTGRESQKGFPLESHTSRLALRVGEIEAQRQRVIHAGSPSGLRPRRDSNSS